MAFEDKMNQMNQEEKNDRNDQDINWYEMQQSAKEAQEKANFTQEQKDISDEWDSLKLSAKQAREAEQKLSKALEEAIKNGADKDVTLNILETWKLQNEKANVFEQNLLKQGKPDIMQDFAAKQKENVQKGMHILGEKVEGINESVKRGVISGGKVVTENVKKAHENVSRVFHEKQKELGEKLNERLDNIKESAYSKISEKRLNGWVKAMDAADKYDKLIEEKENSIYEKADKKIENILKQSEEKLKSNAEKYENTIDDIKNKVPSRADRVKASMLTIKDAITNKEYTNYLSDENIVKNAEKNLEKAKDKLAKANDKTEFTKNLKIIQVKAWAKLQIAKENVLGKFASFKARFAERALDKIKDPKVKDLKEKIAGFAKENDVTRKEAMSMMKEDRGPKSMSEVLKGSGQER